VPGGLRNLGLYTVRTATEIHFDENCNISLKSNYARSKECEKEKDTRFGCTTRAPTLPFRTQLLYAGRYSEHSCCIRFLTKSVKGFRSHEDLVSNIESFLIEDQCMGIAMHSADYIGSRLDYCNSMFYKMSDINFNNLQRIQNRAARIVCGVGRRQQNARRYVTTCTGYLFTLGRILNWQLCVLNHTSCDNQIIWQ